jgi:hypothetical protein
MARATTARVAVKNRQAKSRNERPDYARRQKARTMMEAASGTMGLSVDSRRADGGERKVRDGRGVERIILF